MSRAIDIVKRGKRPTEVFDINKLHASIYAACVSERSPDGQAIQIAQQVCDAVVTWCVNKHEITSEDIRRQAAAALAKFHPGAAYIYEHHRMIM